MLLLRQQLSLDAYIRSLRPAAWFRAGQGQTVTGSGVSQWDDISGNARHLKQGTDANRPVSLLHSGTNYLYLPGVSGNYASTPDSATHPTGDIDIRVRASAVDWTPSSLFYLMAKYQSSAGAHSWVFRVETTGALRFVHSQDGTVDIGAVSTAAASLTDGATYWLRVTRASASGDVIFYTAADSDTDPTSWTKLGNTVSTSAGAINDGAALLNVGAAENSGTGGPMAGRIYRAIIKNGIDGPTVVDFDPSRATDQAGSFVASTGETWTINSTGSKPAQIVGRSSLLFDGTADFLKCDAFTLNQPTCVLLVGKQVSWTLNDRLCDGNTQDSGAFAQNDTTPKILLFAGTSGVTRQSPVIGSYFAACGVINGASSVCNINNTETTGNAGINNMGGFTLGANGAATAAQFSNIQVAEVILLPIALDATQRARIVAGLMARHGVA